MWGEYDKERNRHLEFVLTGFRQDDAVRRFSFQRLGDDRERTEFTVGADLSLARKYAIALQDLPLLCRRILETRMESERLLTFTFTEEDMRAYSTERTITAANAAQRKKPARRPPPGTLGKAWRGPSA